MEKYSQEKPGKGALKAIIVLLFFCAIGAGVWFTGTHYIVNTRAGIKIYPKSSFNFTDVYVDMNSMSVIGLRSHVGLVRVMASQGDIELVPGGTALKKMAEMGEAISDAVYRIDEKYHISDNVEGLIRKGQDKYRELDEKYQITDKANRAIEEGDKLLQKGADALNNWLNK